MNFDQREKAQLFLSILRLSLDEQRSQSPDGSGPPLTLGDAKVYALFARAAGDWAADEQIAAAALAVVLMASGATLNEVQVADFRKYAEEYFERHGEDASIKQIKVEEDDLEPLLDVLRRGSERSSALDEAALEVQAGR